MSRAKLKPPVLTLDAAQEQAAQQVIKRFLQERFELELGSFEAQEVLDLFAGNRAAVLQQGDLRRAEPPEGAVREHRKRLVGTREELTLNRHLI